MKRLTTLVFNLQQTMQSSFTTVNANVNALKSEVSELKNSLILKYDVKKRKANKLLYFVATVMQLPSLVVNLAW